ncbi:hypothetical protein [Nocardiopsis halophila]|uniref:hypothetical protein n=1 Tax=Nocardiopsis halophila TaxID=141692 RepID=UPI00034D7399|nr:hypothetical protein [Nocardiopsis halophila]
MRYVVAEWSRDWNAYWSDPRAYLSRLPELLPELPPGAGAFAREEAHFDFSALRCVKDLVLERIGSTPGGGLALEFAPAPFKHDAGLRVEYAGVVSFALSTDSGEDWEGLGSVMLDEILPAEVGCSHEIAFTGGSVGVACADLDAVWTVRQD